MKKEQLITILEELAVGDLSEDCIIEDHPCSVAVRALNKLSDDISVLKGTLKRNKIRGKSKREQILIGSICAPDF